MAMDKIVSRVLDSYAESLALPADTVELIDLARSDLYSGPVYLDGDGEECSCFDVGARQFDFRSACDKIGEALDSVSDIYVDTCAEDWSDREPQAEEIDGEVYEPDYSDWYHVDRFDVIAHICGRELARHVR